MVPPERMLGPTRTIGYVRPGPVAVFGIVLVRCVFNGDDLAN